MHSDKAFAQNEHIQLPPSTTRYIILGASGFIGRELVGICKENNLPFLGVSSCDLDLRDSTSEEKLSRLFNENDCLLFLSTISPGKGPSYEALIDNIQMARTVVKATQGLNNFRVIYLSSDAVYGLNSNIITEDTPASPCNTYGTMHLAREQILRQELGQKVQIIRSTMVIGAQDTHNAYGPNRFIRSAVYDNKIQIFGDGLEKRSYINIHDLCRLILLMPLDRQHIINAAHPESISFQALAGIIINQLKTDITIEVLPRTLHPGDRLFDQTRLFHAQWTDHSKTIEFFIKNLK